MKITYLKAENFAGIKIGTGRDVIEIDFSNNKNPLVLLLGENGSGKTSLMSILHPLRGTNDNRSPILEDQKGYKEVHIVEGNDKYIIRHMYKPNKSFIEKNGKELNENGNITSFNQIIKDELGVDEDYFKVGRLGNNVTNFINLKSSDRKKYIGNFLPNIDDYLKLFDIAKTKYSMMNKELKNIAGQLDKLPEYSILVDKAKSLENSIEIENTTIQQFEKELTKIEFTKENLVESFKSNPDRPMDILLPMDVKELRLEVSQLKKEVEKANEVVNNYIQKYPNLANYDDEKTSTTIQELIDGINNFEKMIVEIKTKKAHCEQQRSDLMKRLTVLNGKITEDVEEQLVEVQNNIKSSRENINKANKSIENVDSRLFEYSIADFNKIKFKATKVNELITNNILTVYNYENFNFESISKQSSLTERYNELQESLIDIEKFISYTKNNEHQLKILDKKPENCMDKTCAFITNSLQFKEEYYDNLADYEDEREEVLKEIKNIEEQLKSINEVKEFLKECNIAMQEFNELQNMFIEGYFGKQVTSYRQFIDEVLSRRVEGVEELLDTNFIYNAISIKNEMEVAENYLENYLEIEKNLLIQKNNSDSLLAEKEELLNEIEELKAEEQEYSEQEVTYTKKINIHKSKRNILENLVVSRNVINQKTSSYDNSYNLLVKVEDSLHKLDELNINMRSLQKSINDHKRIKDGYIKEKTKNEKDLNYLEVLMDNKKNLDEKFEATKLIKNALDPKQGIPLLFIDDFLQSITEKTNNLLSLAYDDRFKISFDITEKDFFIRVHRLFSELEDINQASQGETSMTTLSLSLSMIENMIKKYNIIYLDEIDATLSTENRRLFLNMLEKQLLDLGIEQIFIISHNNEFYSYPVDLILFKNNDVDLNDKEFMTNKNVIFNINE